MGSALLQIMSGARQGQQVSLSTSAPLVIGRRHGDLLFDDPMVSSKHCTISYRDGQWVLVDHGSTNGTLVNGRQLREAPLSAGTEITVGQNRLVMYLGTPSLVEDDESMRSSSALLEIAWMLDEELVQVGAGERGRRPADAIGQDLRLPPGLNPVLEVATGVDAGKVFRFTRGNVAIGRRTGEVPLADVEVSRHHAVIDVFGREMIFLRDVGSTNGTYHNGQRVKISRLRPGDTIGCGKTVLRLQVAG